MSTPSQVERNLSYSVWRGSFLFIVANSETILITRVGWDLVPSEKCLSAVQETDFGLQCHSDTCSAKLL